MCISRNLVISLTTWTAWHL